MIQCKTHWKLLLDYHRVCERKNTKSRLQDLFRLTMTTLSRRDRMVSTNKSNSTHLTTTTWIRWRASMNMTNSSSIVWLRSLTRKTRTSERAHGKLKATEFPTPTRFLQQRDRTISTQKVGLIGTQYSLANKNKQVFLFWGDYKNSSIQKNRRTLPSSFTN